MVSKATSPIVSLHVAKMDEDEDDESDGVKPILSNRNVSLSVQDIFTLRLRQLFSYGLNKEAISQHKMNLQEIIFLMMYIFV